MNNPAEHQKDVIHTSITSPILVPNEFLNQILDYCRDKVRLSITVNLEAEKLQILRIKGHLGGSPTFAILPLCTIKIPGIRFSKSCTFVANASAFKISSLGKSVSTNSALAFKFLTP